MKRSNLKYDPLEEDAEGNALVPEPVVGVPEPVPETVPATVDEVRAESMTVKEKRALIRKMYEAGIDGNVEAAEWITTPYTSETDKIAAARAILDKA